MATYDMTSSDTAGVGANVLAVPTVVGNTVRTIEATLDIEIMKSFNTSCTGDIDFAAGNDIIDTDDLTQAAGTYLVLGTAGETNVINTASASTYAAAALALVATADTIDVLIAGAAPSTGRLRVYAVIADVSSAHTEAAAAARDLL
jgi:hypothetical protein